MWIFCFELLITNIAHEGLMEIGFVFSDKANVNKLYLLFPQCRRMILTKHSFGFA